MTTQTPTPAFGKRYLTNWYRWALWIFCFGAAYGLGTAAAEQFRGIYPLDHSLLVFAINALFYAVFAIPAAAVVGLMATVVRRHMAPTTTLRAGILRGLVVGLILGVLVGANAHAL